MRVKRNTAGCVYQFRGQGITMIRLRAHPGMQLVQKTCGTEHTLRKSENDVMPSLLCSQRDELLFSSHIQMTPKHFCRQNIPGNALKHNPINGHKLIHHVYLGEFIQGNTIRYHYHFHDYDWWMRNEQLMFTYWAFAVSSCTVESPYLSLTVTPLRIAVLLHHPCFHYSPSISVKTAVHTRIKH